MLARRGNEREAPIGAGDGADDDGPPSGVRRAADPRALASALAEVRGRGAVADLEDLERALGAWLGAPVQILPAPRRAGVRAAPASGRVAPADLGPRLRAVAGLIQEGLTDKEIAQALGVRHATARTYVQRLCRLLGVSGRGGVLRWARAAQLGARRG